MRNLLKFLLTSLLLVLVVAVGAEVVALHRSTLLHPLQAAPTVVVRKAAYPTTPPKTVRPVPGPPPASTSRHKAPALAHKKSPAS
ncbi:hypothetical protein [Hymenobacter terricola]|uniref:hypothetical protein n=1 Tax=Hymenobacter terricola TaxID=2819236 RepID=UPI001B311BAD|nr:hypothetical protein [Hymenobacter terricola]